MKLIRKWLKDAFSLIGRELASVFSSYKTAIPFIVIMFIPTLYAGMFLWSFWNPYGKTEELSVAIVNEDKGAKMNDKTINIGKDVVDSLKKDNTFTWRFLSKKQAKDELNSDKIYMYIEIPSDFSAHAASLLDDKPKKAELHYVSNQGRNFMVSKINDTAVEKLQQKLSHKITETYAEAMFDALKEVSGGLNDATDGSQQITDGLKTITSNTETMKEKLSEKTNDLSRLADGSKQSEEGLQSLQSGTSTLLSSTKQLQEGATTIHSGTKQLAVGASDFSSKMGQLADASTKLNQTSQTLAQQMTAFLAKHPEYQQDREFLTLLAMSKGIADGSTSFDASMKQATQGSETLATSVGSLVAGQEKVNAGFQALQQGEQQLHAGTTKLYEGSQSLSSGTQSVEQGWKDVIDNLGKLNDGQNKALDGSETLTSKLRDATNEANDVKGTDTLYNMFANPVKLTKDIQHEIPNYGTALSPYFLSMGLFVGIFVLTVLFPFKESAGTPQTGFGWYISKTFMIVFASICQSLILDSAMIWMIGLKVEHIPEFIFFTIVTSITFAFMIQFLVTALANVGRFLVIVFMVTQLTSSGGTFPIELIPSPLQHIYNALPMSFTIEGFRSIISLDRVQTVYDNALTLSVYIVISAILSLATFSLFHYVQTKKSAKQNV